MNKENEIIIIKISGNREQSQLDFEEEVILIFGYNFEVLAGDTRWRSSVKKLGIQTGKKMEWT